MLAVMYTFYEWSHYLKGVSIPTEVLMDHQNLTYFRKPQNLNRRQALSRVSNRDVTTQDSMMRGQGGLATEAN